LRWATSAYLIETYGAEFCVFLSGKIRIVVGVDMLLFPTIEKQQNHKTMSFFKKIFDSKDKNKSAIKAKKERDLVPYKEVPWMTDKRLENLSICLEAGFKPASSLPTEFNRQLRPAIEIAKRLNAIKSLVLWLMVPPENLENEKILKFIDQNDLMDFMTTEEKTILSLPRDDEQARNSIGWKFENAWPLAWFFGYREPEIKGAMMTGEQMQEILMNHTCPIEESIEEWIVNKKTISEEDVIQKEDLFYCLHNAVRSAQLGGKTVPDGFHPVGNGGVIHERRHSLTWMLSKDIDWEETDLST